MSSFYITTAIYYPNGSPHLGHAYEMIAADAIARYRRLKGNDVFFMTGTDVHGLKMAQAARAAGVTPRELADRNGDEFLKLAQTFDIGFDRFIRTTDADHIATCQELWRRMEAAGDIYLDRYEGWYSVRDEAFYGEDEIVPNPDGEGYRSPQGTPVEWTVEESYFFRLSRYADRLLRLYDEQPGFLRPEARLNEARSFVAGGLKDLSISRTSFDWGVPVPGAPGHVMYVWVDALTNYLTRSGWPAEGWEARWPADLHVIGKDIVRFHAVYWPAFLMSVGLPLPRAEFGHGFLLQRGEKMGKSAGNAEGPFGFAATYGVDPIRWFLLREVPFGQDGSYSHEAIVTRTNAELANGIGNLAQRSLSIVAKQCGGAIPARAEPDTAEAELRAALTEGTAAYMDAMDSLALHRGLESLMKMVSAANGYFADAAPWALAKTDRPRMEAVLAETLDAVRRIALLLAPACPSSAARLLDQLGVAAARRSFEALDIGVAAGTALPTPQGVFPRVNAPVD
ncbi:MAG: methionine--tRNA ligase [Sphingomonadaceae bacterium]|nr:methionine--tRNA ligase [Sphingomonadaceae bacterium]